MCLGLTDVSARIVNLNLGPQKQEKGTDSLLLLGLNNYVHPLIERPTSLRSIRSLIRPAGIGKCRMVLPKASRSTP